jgi:hypothetical protein
LPHPADDGNFKKWEIFFLNCSAQQYCQTHIARVNEPLGCMWVLITKIAKTSKAAVAFSNK